jgi:hypothetical protein
MALRYQLNLSALGSDRSPKGGVVEKIAVHEGIPRRIFLPRSLPLEALS